MKTAQNVHAMQMTATAEKKEMKNNDTSELNGNNKETVRKGGFLFAKKRSRDIMSV